MVVVMGGAGYGVYGSVQVDTMKDGFVQVDFPINAVDEHVDA